MTPEELLDVLGELVSCESPSGDEAATRRCGDLLAEEVRRRTGLVADRVVVGGRTHLRWTAGTPRVLLLGHLDTVWPAGTLARRPFRVDEGIARGPGVFDMKAGLVQALAALTRLPDLDGVSLLVTSDEELGSPTSAGLVVDSARGCRAVLVCEPSERGAVKVARKGVAQYRVVVEGRAAHAGLEPERGVNAAAGAARALLAAQQLADPARGTTVVPTTVVAGTTANTVPARAEVALDVRAFDPEELERVDAELKAVCESVDALVPGARTRLCGGLNRPPLTRDASEALFAAARRHARKLGMAPLEAVAVGGASDGNLTAAAGIPTLDGLGPAGGGAHAEDEHVLVPDLAPRAALLAALVAEAVREAR